MVSILTEGVRFPRSEFLYVATADLFITHFRCSQHIFPATDDALFDFPVWLLGMIIQLKSRHMGLTVGNVLHFHVSCHLEN